ncbi:MAG: hypothetical protein EON54_07390 [Alcaligenaceae bacterium]|nr:MAG: hypothetical protein EON54_07390 [Alcaligenaceae bacterium]
MSNTQTPRGFFAALVAAAVLAACSTPQQQPQRSGTEFTTLSDFGGYSCMVNSAYPDMAASAETHRCHFSADGITAHKWATTAQRSQVAIAFARDAKCPNPKVITDAVVYSPDRPTVPLHRVGIQCSER